MNRILPLLLALLALPATASAHLVDVTAGLSLWNYQPTGYISYVGTRNDLRDNMGLGRNTTLGGWVSLEHPIPLIPNIKLSYIHVANSGNGQLVARFGAIQAAANVHSLITLNQGDVILYYSPVNNVLKLDLGVDVKIVDGSADLTSSVATVNKSFTGAVPLLYTNVGLRLPFTGLSVGAQGAAIAYSGDQLWDVRARVSWESPFGIGIRGGYRAEHIKVNNISSVDVDATISGPYAALFFHF